MIVSDFLKEQSGIRHGFFTREGGVSTGLYASLNCGFGSGDIAENVGENRARVAAKLGTSRAELVTVRQVHSSRVVVADTPWQPDAAAEADAIVTRMPSLAIGVLTADCTPILFADPEAMVVAAAHAGWKGAKAGIVDAVIEAMEDLGARRDRICAAIGPTISQTAYEVGPEFEAAFIDDDTANGKYFTRPTPEARPHFDLPGYCRDRARAARVAHVELPQSLHVSKRIAFFQLSSFGSQRRGGLRTSNFRHCYYVMWIRGFPGAFSRRYAVDACPGYSNVSGRFSQLELRIVIGKGAESRNFSSTLEREAMKLKGATPVTRVTVMTARCGARRVALPLIGGLIALSLAACETSSSTSGDAVSSNLTSPQPVRSKPIAFAPVIGAPAKVSSKMNELLVASAGQKNIPVVAPKEAEYTVRGYLVAAADAKGTKLSYIWDITDKGGKRAKRIQGDEMIEGKKGGDPWALVDEPAMQRVATKTAEDLIAWMPTERRLRPRRAAPPKPLSLQLRSPNKSNSVPRARRKQRQMCWPCSSPPERLRRSPSPHVGPRSPWCHR